MGPKRILKVEDMQSHDDYITERQMYSDERARKLGYPSAEVLRLADDLTRIAGEWRETKADALVDKYRETLYRMILGGYDVDTLPVQDHLPEPLMPKLPPPAVRSAIIQAYKELAAE